MIDMKKKYRTREGQEVRIYAMDGGSDGGHIHGAVKFHGVWTAWVWSKEGSISSTGPQHKFDLIEIKPSAIDQMIEVIITAKNELGERMDRPDAVLAVSNLLQEARRIRVESGDE